MPKEARARIKINKLLEEAGWRLLDCEAGKANVQLETHLPFERSENFEGVEGYADYALLDGKGRYIGVLEAKAEDKNPLEGKEQARRYAERLGVRNVILSNGNLHYYWDTEFGNPKLITSFPTLTSLEQRKGYEPNPAALSTEHIDAGYIARTKIPRFEDDPDYRNEKARAAFIEEKKLKLLRDYQIKAVKKIQEAAANGKDRYLFEMATGTGKTLTAAAVIKLFLRTGNARRVLFLVDRIELEDQAEKAFRDYLDKDYQTVIYKRNRDSWRRAEIVVSTVQSLTVDERFEEIFSPLDFELVISDEAHRSIGGNARALFEYFSGYKLGLTATPKAYLKNVDQEHLSANDPRALERRILLDTYKTFGCEVGEPTFRYSLIDGVKDGNLVNPVVLDARTEITTELLAKEGYATTVTFEDGSEQEEIFGARHFEKTFFNEETNIAFARTVIERGMLDPVSSEFGKTLLFCVSQNHAAKLTNILNDLAMKKWPGRYTSDFAIQVTSRIPNAQQYTKQFSNNRLLGTTRFLEDYDSSRARICVTVGMMTTGYDCQDLLNVVLMRPVFSPADYVQMKGRGTRLFTFRYGDKAEEKKRFMLMDFFGNFSYFEDEFNFDEIIKLPPLYTPPTEPEGEAPKKKVGTVELQEDDKLRSVAEIYIGNEGMKVDRMYYNRFAEDVKCDPEAKKLFAQEGIDAVENYVRHEKLNKPTDYFTVDKLLDALGIDRKATLRELLLSILTGEKLLNRNELIDQEINRYIMAENPNPEVAPIIRILMESYIGDEDTRDILDSKQFARLATNPHLNLADLRALGEQTREKILTYCKDFILPRHDLRPNA